MAGVKAQRPSGKGDGTPPPSSPDADSLRIMLIGRTGMDGRLRLDPAVELVRARTALDAVGELSLARRQDASLPTVALIAAASDPAASDEDDEAGPRTDSPARREFLAALRRIDANIRVLWVDGEAGTMPEGYDGSVSAEAGVEEIRDVMTGKGKRESQSAPVAAERKSAAVVEPATPAGKASADEPAAKAPAKAPDEAPKTYTAREPAAPPSAASPQGEDLSYLLDTIPAGKVGGIEMGDEVLVRLLLQGRDITDAAMEIARRRLSGRDLSFVMDAAAPERGIHEAPVAWRGRILGKLRSRDLDADALAVQANWLAAWLILRDQHAQLREAAFADPLTGAHNRRYFDQFLRMAMEDAKKERRGITLLMFDIDDFKIFNDRFGHAAGDEILRETVRLLRSVIRPSDKVCRIGGDEFAVVFHEPTGPRTPSSRPPSDVCQIAERFQKEVAEHRFPKLGREAPGRLTISGGLATYPWDGATPEALLARADDLAIQSKRRGKNCIVFGPGAEGDADGLTVIGHETGTDLSD